MFGLRPVKKAGAYSYSDRGGREENEDTVQYLSKGKNSTFYAIADGLGGHGGGKAASQAAIECVTDFYTSTDISNPKEFNIWFQGANQRVLDMQTKECEMKTTLVTLLIEGSTAMWAHVGDSRLYHFVDGRLVSRTFDHSVSQMAVLRGEIKDEEIRGHCDRNKLLKALGREETISIDVSTIVDISKNEHAFLLCTDGFWEYVTEADMTKALKASATASDWVSRMVKILKRNAKPGNDNNSAIAVICKGE